MKTGGMGKFILRWANVAIGVECDDMTSLSSTRHVASDPSADMSAHSKTVFRMPQRQLVAPKSDEGGRGAGAAHEAGR